MPQEEAEVRRQVWESSRDYYRIAAEGTLATIDRNEAYRLAFSALTGRDSLLDVGCGEGTILNHSVVRRKFGMDISPLALREARANHGLRALVVADAARLPFRNDVVETVGSFFTIEHLPRPEAVLAEMIRVTAPGGLVIVCGPNYGSPINRNPFFPEHRYKFFVRRLWRTMNLLAASGETLEWEPNHPRFLQTREVVPECDIFTNPYLGTLLQFFRCRGLAIEAFTAGWSWDEGNETWCQRLFRWLARFRLPPFCYYGPIFCVVARKPIVDRGR